MHALSAKKCKACKLLMSMQHAINMKHFLIFDSVHSAAKKLSSWCGKRVYCRGLSMETNEDVFKKNKKLERRKVCDGEKCIIICIIILY